MRMPLLTVLLALSLAAQAQPPAAEGEKFSDPAGHWVELESLVYRAGLARHPGYGGQCLSLEPHKDLCPVRELLGRNTVFLSGKRLKVKEKENRLFLLSEEVAPLLQPDLPRAAGAQPPLRVANSLAFEPANVTVPGRTNVVFFYTQYCPSCWKFFPVMEAWNRTTPEVALIEADIGDFGSPMSEALQVRATPTVRVFDPEGHLVADGRAAEDWLTATYHVEMPTTLKCVGSHKAR